MVGASAVRRDFVEFWGSLGSYWGIPPATARVYAWLISQPQPCNADAIVEGLGMSRGAVSMAARELRDWGLVSVERSMGSWQVVYRPETDLEVAIRNIVQTRKASRVGSALGAPARMDRGPRRGAFRGGRGVP